MSVIIAKRTHTYGVTVSLVVWECPECGIVYGVPKGFADACRDNGDLYYCPNGHRLGWTKTKADRERERAERAESRARMAENAARYQRERAERERRSASAYKGHLTRMRMRIANGICPVPGCKRSGFDRVMSHIASQHPEWLDEYPEVVAGG